MSLFLTPKTMRRFTAKKKEFEQTPAAPSPRKLCLLSGLANPMPGRPAVGDSNSGMLFVDVYGGKYRPNDWMS